MELRTISDIQSLQAQNGKLGKENLGQTEFMKLMLAQMQNQDPFNRSITPSFSVRWPSSAR